MRLRSCPARTPTSSSDLAPAPSRRHKRKVFKHCVICPACTPTPTRQRKRKASHLDAPLHVPSKRLANISDRVEVVDDDEKSPICSVNQLLVPVPFSDQAQMFELLELGLPCWPTDEANEPDFVIPPAESTSWIAPLCDVIVPLSRSFV